MHPLASLALALTPAWSGQPYKAAHDFVDGSFLDGRAGWAFVKVVEARGGGLYYVGAARASVALDGPQFIGAEGLSNISGELSAAAWALLDGLKAGPGVECHLHYDCHHVSMAIGCNASLDSHQLLVGHIRMLVGCIAGGPYTVW